MNKLLVLLASGAAALAANSATAQMIIDNGTIQIGVDSLAQLNIYNNAYYSAGGTLPVGLRDLRTGYESTSPGCLCEGWGIADLGSNTSGYANNSAGTGGLNFVRFTSGGTGTHDFTPSASPNLYKVLVTLTNNSATQSGVLVYRRTMDWDIEPTPFSEYSTVQGTGDNIVANDNGFCSSDPLSVCDPLLASGNFVDSGPWDHGANFDITFSPLAAGQSLNFSIFYGAAPTERAAYAALSAVGSNIYSFGQNNADISGGNGSTFIFAFAGGSRGSLVPEPAS
ncbi:hypothetical protein EUV02_14005 [Polymorphobacter arshaanensis]|uniref:PEP-CTERM sorting domain-containing protein n=1 Tax=Glacieibacterium arshaanense TaxID=2511025 RepID=A0A4Y9ELS1_9SPHN|nr:hypothetical protein [Polymorphobacter arshaanensis]TFU01396.1 hypothetical protein EUV02_14005 [Polymorphobacter arshaanensis]